MSQRNEADEGNPAAYYLPNGGGPIFMGAVDGAAILTILALGFITTFSVLVVQRGCVGKSRILQKYEYLSELVSLIFQFGATPLLDFEPWTGAAK